MTTEQQRQQLALLRLVHHLASENYDEHSNEWNTEYRDKMANDLAHVSDAIDELEEKVEKE